MSGLRIGVKVRDPSAIELPGCVQPGTKMTCHHIIRVTVAKYSKAMLKKEFKATQILEEVFCFF